MSKLGGNLGQLERDREISLSILTFIVVTLFKKIPEGVLFVIILYHNNGKL